MAETSIGREKGVIAFFRSEYFVLITFISLITPLMVHTANLLLQVSSIKNSWYGYFFAFSFDLAIFTFSLNGRRSQAVGLAFIVFILNVCFFNLDALNSILGEAWIVKLFVTVVISGAGSWIVHSYVVFFNERIGERREIVRWMSKNAEKEKVIESLQSKLTEVKNECRLLREDVERLTSSSNVEANGTDYLELSLAELSEINFPHTCAGCGCTVPSKGTLYLLAKFCKNKGCRHKTIRENGIDELSLITD